MGIHEYTTVIWPHEVSIRRILAHRLVYSPGSVIKLLLLLLILHTKTDQCILSSGLVYVYKVQDSHEPITQKLVGSGPVQPVRWLRLCLSHNCLVTSEYSIMLSKKSQSLENQRFDFFKAFRSKCHKNCVIIMPLLLNCRDCWTTDFQNLLFDMLPESILFLILPVFFSYDDTW